MKNDCSTVPVNSQRQGSSESPAVPLNVTVIPATRGLDRGSAQLKKRMDTLRVAAYCRVSTGDESQQTSYRNQVSYYTGLIRSRMNWTFAGVYADEGLSGTSTARRENFKRMLQDARNEKIDYIITKSISRFARNTVTTLSLVRELRDRERPVGIFFEKENIDSLDPTGELVLTIMSALAQEESESISRNIRWALQKKQKAGIPQVNLERMLGYDKGEGGTWLVNEEQARTVRDIFERYLSGASANGIAREFNESGITTLAGKRWSASAIIRILRNEKYAGDLLMQKTYTADILSHRSVVNHGQMPKFYFMDHHAPIISRSDWNKAQLLLNGREWNPNAPGRYKENGASMFGRGNTRGRAAHVFKNLTAFDGENNRTGGSIVLRRCVYSCFVNLSAEAGRGGGNCVRYSYSVPMWITGEKCRRQQVENNEASWKETDAAGGKPERTGAADGMPDTIIPHALCECALEQSFMEMLYICRWDWLKNHGDSRIEKQFNISCGEMDKADVARKRHDAESELVREQISRLLKETEALNARIRSIGFTGGCYSDGGMGSEEYEALCRKRETCRQRLAALKGREERLKADADRPQQYRASHEKFLEYLKNLPEVNAAGMPLRVNGIFSPGQTEWGNENVDIKEQALDLLLFDRAAYSAFIRSGTVYGDMVEYETSFGVKLIASGNARMLADFIGFRRCRADGTVEILDQEWKVNGRPLHHAGVRRIRKKKGIPEACAEASDLRECAL